MYTESIAPRAQSMSLGSLIWEGVRRTSPLVGCLGLVATIVTWQTKPDAQIPLLWVVVAGSSGIVLLTALALATSIAARAASRSSPKVRFACRPPNAYANVQVLLLLDPSPYFVQGCLVSVHQRRDERYDVLVAIGTVLTIQENGLIQVGVQWFVEDRDGLTLGLLRNDVRVLKSLSVKPNVPEYFITRAYERNFS